MDNQTTWKPIDFRTLSVEQRTACEELLRRGNIDFLLHPGQLNIWKGIQASKNDRFVICTGRQTGKSYFCVALCIYWAISKDRQNIIYGSPYREQTKDVVGPKFQELLDFLPDDLQPRRSGNKYIFPNGSIIHIAGVNTNGGNRLRGYTNHLIILDECRDMPELEEFLQSVADPTTMTTDGVVIMASTPPSTPGHPFSKKYIPEAIKTNCFYHLTYKSNPVLTPTKLARLLAEEGVEEGTDRFKREWLADWTLVNKDMLVIHDFNKEENKKFFETWIPPYQMRSYTAIDIGARDFTAMVFAVYDWSEGVCVVLDEAVMTHPSTHEICEMVKKKEEQWFDKYTRGFDSPQTLRWTDVDHRLTKDMAIESGLTIKPTRKWDNNGMLNRLDTSLRTGKLRIHPRCVATIGELLTGIWDKTGETYARSKTQGHLDCIDAIKYLNLNVKWDESFGLMPHKMKHHEPGGAANDIERAVGVTMTQLRRGRLPW